MPGIVGGSQGMEQLLLAVINALPDTGEGRPGPAADRLPGAFPMCLEEK